MSSKRSVLRKLVLLALMVLGGGLVVAGVIVQQTSAVVAGMAAWILVVISLLWGVRFRLEQASLETRGLREDIVRVRRSQLLMHARVSTRLRDHRKRFEQIRESQLKLHSRVAQQGISVTRKQDSLIQQVRDLLAEGKLAGIEAQRMTLRAYRESHAAWVRVGDVLEKNLAASAAERTHWTQSSNALEKSISDIVDCILRNNEQHAEKVSEQLELILAEIGKSPEALSSLVEDSRQGLIRLADSLAQVADDIQGLRGQSNEFIEQGRSIGETLERAMAAGVSDCEESADRHKKTQDAVIGLSSAVTALEKSWVEGKAAIILKHRKSKREISQAVEALSQLAALVPLKAPYPLLDGWAMDPVSVLSLVEHILTKKPRLIVECGSGTSTVWLAAALRHAGGGRLVSLEHLETYAGLTREALVAQGLEHIAEVRAAPLVQIEVDGEHFKWYDSVTFSDLHGIDLLVVDGPPEGTGPQARFPALPMMAHRLRPRALVVLDDSDRPEEEAIINRWLEGFPELVIQRAGGPRTALMDWRARDID